MAEDALSGGMCGDGPNNNYDDVEPTSRQSHATSNGSASKENTQDLPLSSLPLSAGQVLQKGARDGCGWGSTERALSVLLNGQVRLIVYFSHFFFFFFLHLNSCLLEPF